MTPDNGLPAFKGLLLEWLHWNCMTCMASGGEAFYNFSIL